MHVFKFKPDMYDFRHLPALASFLLNGHVRELVKDQLQMSKEVNVPILRFLSHLSDDELLEMSIVGTTELLEYLAQNKAADFINNSLEKWVKNQLPMLQQMDVITEDIALIHYVRSTILKKYALIFNPDPTAYHQLVQEIDVFFVGFSASSTNTYVSILRHKVEEEAHLSTQLINASPGVVFLIDLLNQKMIFVNDKVNDVLGYPHTTMESWDPQVLYTLVHPEDIDELRRHIAAVRADMEGKTHEVEYRLRHQNGGYRWLRTYDVPFKRDDKGTPIQLLGQTFDISNEKQVSISLAKREEQLLSAQSLAHIGSFEWDLNTNATTTSPELDKIFGVEGQPLEEFHKRVHPADRERLESEIQKSLATGQYECEYRYLSPEKEKVLWAKAVVKFENGKPVLMKGTVQDITDRKKTEQELVQRTVDLQRSNENLQQFASIASHDLNEPLRKISTFTDLVFATEGEKLTERSKNHLLKVKDSSKRMRTMIDDILAFSAVNKPQEPEKYNLQALLDESLEALEFQVKEKKAVIKSDGLPEAVVIPFQMRQLFQNLLSNSIKFAKKNVQPEISITHAWERSVPDLPGLRPADKYLVIRFADNGIGFEQEYADRIFGLFNRLHGKQMYEGTGIGLAICRKAAENHGGILQANSSVGKGATFTLYLPQ